MIGPNERSQNTKALTVRTSLNETQGNFRLAEWISSHSQLTADSRLLDLGAGTGDILLQFASAIGNRGSCDAVDINADGLKILREKAKKFCCPVRIHALDMDWLCDGDSSSSIRDLTHITSVYSLYYSRDAAHLLRQLSSWLVPAGVVIVVAPAPGNNSVWYTFLKQHGVVLSEWLESLADSFLRDCVLPVAASCFQRHSCYWANNTVEVKSALHLCDYWRSSTYYSAEADDAVCRAINTYYETLSTFPIEKKIGLIRMEQPRL